MSGGPQPNRKEMAGQRFSRWMVVRPAGYTPRGSVKWECICDCGTTRILEGAHLRSGRSQSCGCLTREKASAKTTHGNARRGRRTASYRAWHHMLQRCLNPNSTAWRHYGGRGITVCDRWKTYANFFADMGEPPQGHSIERVNNDGNYEPS